MKFRSPGDVLLFCVASLFLLPIALVAQQAVSHVRVVRLSYVSGTVAVKRPGATEWAKALVNTPVQEGFEISTSADSFAEVEFENGSTARLGELSHLAFDQLALDAEGDKLNRMTFEQGYATFHFLPEKHDAYSVKIADATLTPSGKSLFRTDLDKGHVRVEVFNGSVQIVAPSGSAKLGKDKILEYNTGKTEVAFNIQQGMVKDPWDKWTEARDSQASLALTDQAVAAHGPVYGWSDLDTYGEWAMFPGFGYGWSPFAPMGWAPYSMGMWNWYPGMGYTWISGEPWGWLPYHYGIWNFSPDFGWFWMPGDFGFWSPALVSWYMGPGWVGWAPLGLVSQRGLIRPVTTISGTAIQTGQIITPQSVGHVGFSEGTLMERLPFQPGAGGTLTGTPLAAGAATSFTAHAGGAHTLAPSSILMGGEGDKESALLAGRSLREPLRVRLGTTLGGRYAVGGTVGEFRGDAFKGMGRSGGMNGSQPSEDSHGNSQPRLSVLPHGRSAESSRGGGGEMTDAGGEGGFPSATSPSVTAPSSSHAPSSSPSSGHH
jgi:hypothetical protein